MRAFALIILILLCFAVIEGGKTRPRGLRSLRSHHRGAFHGQIGHQKGGQVDLSVNVSSAQDFFAQSPLPFCNDIAVQSARSVAPASRRDVLEVPATVPQRCHLAVFDYGIKTNILRSLAARGEPVLEFGLRRAQGIDGQVRVSPHVYTDEHDIEEAYIASSRALLITGTHITDWSAPRCAPGVRPTRAAASRRASTSRRSGRSSTTVPYRK